MGRKTKTNKVYSDELWNEVNPDNKELMDEFLEYLRSTDHSDSTIAQYRNDLRMFFIWNLTSNHNKLFTDITKRELLKMQNVHINDYEWSSNRYARYKSTLSSFSDYLEAFWDEEYPNFRNNIKKIPAPVKSPVREKSIFTEEELVAILDNLIADDKLEVAVYLALAMYSGRRKQELARFKMSYFRDETVVFGSLYKTDEQVRTKGRGKNGKLLNLYVLKNKFDPYLDLWRKYREENGIESEWLLYNPNDPSSPVSVPTMDNWGVIINKYCDEKKPWYCHSMRHFMCSELGRAGLPPEVVRQLFGCSDITLVSVYDDRDMDDELGKYFDADGIITQEKKKLSDL